MSSLRSVLRINGVYSLVAGVFAMSQATSLADTMGTQAWVVRLVGSGLVVFGAGMLAVFRHEVIDPRLAAVIVWADVAWVFGVALVVASGALSSDGNLILGLLSVPVAVFAVLQYLGVRRVASGA